MYIRVFIGNLVEGRTFSMSVFAHYYVVKARRAGVPVYLFSNPTAIRL
jgi:hypothetical protein